MLSHYLSGVPVNQLGSFVHFDHKNEALTVYLHLYNFTSPQKRPSNGVLLTLPQNAATVIFQIDDSQQELTKKGQHFATVTKCDSNIFRKKNGDWLALKQVKE